VVSEEAARIDLGGLMRAASCFYSSSARSRVNFASAARAAVLPLWSASNRNVVMKEVVARFKRLSNGIGFGVQAFPVGQARLHVGHFDFWVRILDFMCFLLLLVSNNWPGFLLGKLRKKRKKRNKGCL
jgi:hypothetical protein